MAHPTTTRPAVRTKARSSAPSTAAPPVSSGPRSESIGAALPPSACACGGSCPRCVQTKLKLDTPGDRWEQEADRVADAVVAGQPAALVPGTAARMPQRVSATTSPAREDAERGEDEEPGDDISEPVQRLAAPGGQTPRSESHWESRLARSSGAPLAAPLAVDMGRHMGADFSAVLVHADAYAAQSCDGIGARAFTRGSHVYFNAGEFSPHTREGRHTLAHELAHVVQQGAAGAPPIQRMSALDRSSPGTLRDTDVKPWGGSAPSGDEYAVNTDAGTEVRAWVAYGGTPEDHRYWCHGFSLGTYAPWGYSVWSGSQMEKVVRDEYSRVPREQARTGDLAVWVLMPDGHLYGHSAVFKQTVLRGDGTLDTARSRLDTKNGQAALAEKSLADIMAEPEYGYNVAVYRHK